MRLRAPGPGPGARVATGAGSRGPPWFGAEGGPGWDLIGVAVASARIAMTRQMRLGYPDSEPSTGVQ